MAVPPEPPADKVRHELYHKAAAAADKAAREKLQKRLKELRTQYNNEPNKERRKAIREERDKAIDEYNEHHIQEEVDARLAEEKFRDKRNGTKRSDAEYKKLREKIEQQVRESEHYNPKAQKNRKPVPGAQVPGPEDGA